MEKRALAVLLTLLCLLGTASAAGADAGAASGASFEVLRAPDIPEEMAAYMDEQYDSLATAQAAAEAGDWQNCNTWGGGWRVAIADGRLLDGSGCTDIFDIASYKRSDKGDRTWWYWAFYTYRDGEPGKSFWVTENLDEYTGVKAYKSPVSHLGALSDAEEFLPYILRLTETGDGDRTIGDRTIVVFDHYIAAVDITDMENQRVIMCSGSAYDGIIYPVYSFAAWYKAS